VSEVTTKRGLASSFVHSAFATTRCRRLQLVRVVDLRACHQQRTHGLAVEPLHRHLTVPADTHDLRRTEGVVGVGLVDLERQRRLGVARIDADHGEASLFQLVEKPARQLPAFEPDPNRMGRVLLDGRCDGLRRRINLAALHDLVSIIDDADRRFLQ
jgi:hypothetical protein